MADKGLLPQQIWDRLDDDHGTAVSNLAAVVRHVAARRLATLRTDPSSETQ
ncbi:hypothetical protein OG552_34535 [Streptomyces sp. NBC_01476]|uniref:hypothetical protein n=1 Tax=Streptomyces sp. NBC_01476 TaxID=2903881 RepID=UPI002E2EEB43|nr:hypothetical protein [Streptomyces sp. NBC_01476]